MECIYNHDSDCAILNDIDCDGCKFRKSQRQMQDNEAKCNQRLSSLPKTRQLYISEKYYRGKMPWATTKR